MKLIAEIFDSGKLFFIEVIGLELLDTIFLILHPQYSITIEIKRHINLRDLKLPMCSYLILLYINFIQIIFFLF